MGAGMGIRVGFININDMYNITMKSSCARIRIKRESAAGRGGIRRSEKAKVPEEA
jgi:hypothetical protein